MPREILRCAQNDSLLLPLHHADCCLIIVPELPLGVNLIQRPIRLEDGKALVDLWQQQSRPCSALVEADIVVIFVKSATKQLQLGDRRCAWAGPQHVICSNGEVQEEGIDLMLHQVAEGNVASVGMHIDLLRRVGGVVFIHDGFSKIARTRADGISSQNRYIGGVDARETDRKSTRLNSSHSQISYA